MRILLLSFEQGWHWWLNLIRLICQTSKLFSYKWGNFQISYFKLFYFHQNIPTDTHKICWKGLLVLTHIRHWPWSLRAENGTLNSWMSVPASDIWFCFHWRIFTHRQVINSCRPMSILHCASYSFILPCNTESLNSCNLFQTRSSH